MELSIPLTEGLSLVINSHPTPIHGYATGRLQSGFRLFAEGDDLSEEAVGFGVPLVQSGLQTFFPGVVELHWISQEGIWDIEADYCLNLIERISAGKTRNLESRLLYWTKNVLAAMIRLVPILRGALTGVSSLLRKILHWETVYEEVGSSYTVKIHYTINTNNGKILMEINTVELPASIDQVMLMNEQGARNFDLYGDDSGAVLQGKNIGCWDEVTAQEAWFESAGRKVSFHLRQVPNARLFRGRELVGTRLAWAGFGYSFPPAKKNLSLELIIRQLP